MREQGTLDQTIMHCIFVGSPGVGKSSLLKRLLRMQLGPKRTSTQALENPVQVEIIRDVSTTSARVSGFEWQIIEDPVTQASGLIGQLSKGEKVFNKYPLQTSEVMGRLSTKQEKVFEDGHSTMNKQVSEQKGDPDTRDSVPSRQVYAIPEEDHSAGSTQHEWIHQQTEQELKQQERVVGSQKNPPQYSKTLDFFQQVLKEKGVSGLQQQIDNPWTLYLTDSGGQPEFQELLPALAVGPCVFFVVFPLHKDLKEKIEVEYMKPDEQKCMQKYVSSFTLQDSILQSLASIAYTKYKDIKGNEVKPRVMLVATFKDQVPNEEDRQRKIKALEALVKETNAFHQGMIVDASKSQMVFTINNVCNEESENDAKEIRDAFQSFANGFKVHTAAPWLIFSILIQHKYAQDNVISKQECFKTAKECGIHNEEEFEAALQFLHKQTGVLQYYMKPPELSEIVIKDPQHLFSRVSHLVEQTFTFEGTRCSQLTENFKRGIFLKNDYDVLTQQSSRSKLNPFMLLKLLEHLNVVVPLGDGEKYFMPCAIAHLNEDTGHTQSPTIPPLLITFKSGYCPKGLFGALVACTVNKQVANCTLNLDEAKIHRNQICFTMDKHSLLLRVNPTYIYIEIIPYGPHTSLSDLCTPCNGVRRLILKNIEVAWKTLHYSDSANCCLSFECHCDQYVHQEKPHLAVLRNDMNNCFWCMQSKKPVDVRKECYVWLSQVSRQLHGVRSKK